jgi:hypothetical protein
VHRLERPNFALHSRLETTYIADLEEDASQGKLRFYVDPAFALRRSSTGTAQRSPPNDPGPGILFGSYLRPIGPLQVRPELTIIGDVSLVFDDGDNEQLAGADAYAGIGGLVSLRARLNLGQPISDFELEGGVRYLRLFGDIEQTLADRWFASLTYSPQNLPYLGVGLTYNSGQNDDTFQKIEFYGLNVSLRY